MKNAISSLTDLNDLAVIALTGDDATSFLQSQITQDLSSIGPATSALAGYCSARGRLLASMIVLQKNTEPSAGWLLLTKADAASAFAQRLRMFVLRAKVNVEISDLTVCGLSAPRSGQAPENITSPDVPDDAPPYTVVRRDTHILIRTPSSESAKYARWWCLGDPGTDISTSETSLQAWQTEDIAAGLPWVQAATQDTFIPQTLNMDLIGGVSFTKGCYPGQEVVARSHYRGTIRRRMAYAVGAAGDISSVSDLPGSDTFNALKPDNPCGRVINAAISDDALHVLIEVQLADLDTADFRLGSGDGTAIAIHALPYQIQTDATA